MKWCQTLQISCLIFSASFLSPAWAGDMPKNLGCPHYTGRAQSICQKLESTMEWELFGHATIAPGWRVAFAGIAQSFCTLKIEPAVQYA